LSSPRTLDFPDASVDDIRTFFGSDGEVAERALCLGLGSPSSSGPARAQLALLLSICDALHIVSSKYDVLRAVLTITKDHAHVSLYDPVFSPTDHNLLGSLGTHVLPAEQVPSPSPYCTRLSIWPLLQLEVKENTLVFMPHCELVLYERFLRANWASGTLHHVLLLGNDLREYATTYVSVSHSL
jgi:hypothetical protein